MLAFMLYLNYLTFEPKITFQQYTSFLSHTTFRSISIILMLGRIKIEVGETRGKNIWYLTSQQAKL